VPGKNLTPHLKRLEQAMSVRYGWKMGGSSRDDLFSAVGKKAAKVGLDQAAYCEMAATSPAELEVLAELVANGETRFFREPDQFDALKTKVIPHLLSVGAKEQRLDVWSAACSTGEEAYSLAMVLGETLPAAKGWNANLMATDLRGQAIVTASQGHYPYSSVRSIEKRFRESYFVRAGSDGRQRPYEVIPSVRKMIAFRRANVCDSKFWKNLGRKFDLIVCNNLLLYFHAPAAAQTVERLTGALKRGGLLIVTEKEAGYVRHSRLRREPSLPGAFFTKS
jgi:chemotaxis protein methyltransferase CheR